MGKLDGTGWQKPPEDGFETTTQWAGVIIGIAVIVVVAIIVIVFNAVVMNGPTPAVAQETQTSRLQLRGMVDIGWPATYVICDTKTGNLIYVTSSPDGLAQDVVKAESMTDC